MFGLDDRQRMFGTEDYGISAVEPQRDSAPWSIAFARHFHGPESRRFDLNLKLLHRRDEDVPSVRLASQNR
jgi:hypothetical protein